MNPQQKCKLFNVGLVVTLTPLWMLPLLLLCEVGLTVLWTTIMVFIVLAGLFMMMPVKSLKFMEALADLRRSK
jgi:hypothetical protein